MKCMYVKFRRSFGQQVSAWRLSPLHDYIKQVLRVRLYLRDVDDMVVLDHDKARLAEIRAAVQERLAADRLRLHPHKAHVTRGPTDSISSAMSSIESGVGCARITATAFHGSFAG